MAKITILWCYDTTRTDTTRTGHTPDRHNLDRDTTRTQTDSVFNPDTEKIISEYITMVLCASLYSDLRSAEGLGFV